MSVLDYAAWEGDGVSSGLVGLSYSSITAAYTSNGTLVPYDNALSSMIKKKLIKHPVFTLATDRVPRGTPVSANAGQIAFGGLVDRKYYQPSFTTVPIEEAREAPGRLTYYTTTHDFIYGKTAPSCESEIPPLPTGNTSSEASKEKKKSKLKTLRFTSIVDSGTAPNFIPTAAANELNSLFDPPGHFNKTLGYWTVDCNAKAPYAAYRIGGTLFPMDPRDMIVRSLNGLQGYEEVCFSAFGDGGEDGDTVDFLIGSVWQRSVVIVHDIGRTQLHIAPRRPY